MRNDDKKIGIIGHTGRMGKILIDVIQKSNYVFGSSFNTSSSHNLATVFNKSDFVVDFSSTRITEMVLRAALSYEVPLVICTTGWNVKNHEQILNQLKAKIPIVIAPNTSVGAFLQRYIVAIMTQFLEDDYDIDISDKHHRNKMDAPSGTAKSLIETIQKAKSDIGSAAYTIASGFDEGPRPQQSIGLQITRSANLNGEHEVSFTSNSEQISVKHVAFNRELFAIGVLKIIKWLDNKQISPGLYTMEDIFKKKMSAFSFFSDS